MRARPRRAAAVSHRSRPAAPAGDRLADRCREAQLKLTPRRLAVIALFDRIDQPIDIEEAYDLVVAAGGRMSRASLYRLIADLVKAGTVMELRVGDRRRFLATHKALAFRLEDAKGQGLAAAAPGLSALLTLIAAEHGLPLGGEVLVRFGGVAAGCEAEG